jgi:hypothetical protein
MSEATPVKSARGLLAVIVGLACANLAGCVSTTRQAEADRDQCAAQGLAPSSAGFDDCMARARAYHRDAEASQSVRMQDMQDRSMSDFMHSQNANP